MISFELSHSPPLNSNFIINHATPAIKALIDILRKSLTWVFAKLFLDSNIDLIKETLISTFFVVPELLLVSSLFTILLEDISIKLEMEDHLLNHVFSLEEPVFK
jgi:hypothetical protein